MNCKCPLKSHRLILFAAVVSVITLSAVGLAAENKPEAPTAPATEVKPKPDPAKELAKKVAAAAKAWRKRLPKNFSIETWPPFVVAGDLKPARLHGIMLRSVQKPAEALWQQYFRTRPKEAVTILLFKNDKSYRKWAKKLFGDTRVSHFGYYRPGDRVMVMNIGTGTGTLVHEIVHALMAPDFPACPAWFSEGLGSLYEQCMVRPKGLEGLLNWRLPALLKALREGRLRSLKDLITKGDFRGATEGLNYAQARYFCMYMQERGVLEKYYRLFRAGAGKDPTGLKFVEEVFGKKSMKKVDKGYRDWLSSLKPE
ncbi:MAG: hypothetical protein QF662_01520 [Phycisphaerae bacterium]|nr:hypothetical protein [Phycisphaerae bacterium]